MALTRLQQCAARDAAADFHESSRTPADWLVVASRISTGDYRDRALMPVEALAPIEAVGVEQTCRSWGVDPALWDHNAHAWIREYAICYAHAVASLARRAIHPIGWRP